MKPIEQARLNLEAEKKSGAHDEFIARMSEILDAGTKLKKVMLKRGIRLAKAPCPICGNGMLHGSLAGSKNHLHMYCDGEGCNAMMME